MERSSCVRCAVCAGAGLTCSAGCSTPRRCGASLQLCVTDAEMLTPGFGSYKGAPHVGAWTRLSIMLLRGLAAKHLSPSLSHISLYQYTNIHNAPRWSRLRVWGETSEAPLSARACGMDDNETFTGRQEGFGRCFWVWSGVAAFFFFFRSEADSF